MAYLFAIAIIAATVYISWRLVQTRAHDQQEPSITPRRRVAPRGPDDDPDFLRSLDDR
ncbi:hypothetical protein [Gordonia shandongensis]|uniref:hypothetical protein n=1 Tax=Gordonia shandongensis TaxID=376351 RepID=UPI000401101A|nr:hypothetical protein [Gordonia shandongensis]